VLGLAGPSPGASVPAVITEGVAPLSVDTSRTAAPPSCRSLIARKDLKASTPSSRDPGRSGITSRHSPASTSRTRKTKVPRSFVGDLQPPRDAALVHEVFDAVLDAVSTRLEQFQFTGRIVGVEVVHFGRHGRAEVHVDDGVVATSTDRQVELRVVLLKDEYVGAGIVLSSWRQSWNGRLASSTRV